MSRETSAASLGVCRNSRCSASPRSSPCAASAVAAAPAHAAEVVTAVPQEVFATADVTPVLYFAFLASSFTFAAGTVSGFPPL